MPLTQARKAAALDAAIPGTQVFLALHTAVPPSLLNEVSVARIAVTVPISGGGTTRTATGGSPLCTFIVPTVTIASVGIWTALTGGTLLASYDATDFTTINGDQVDVQSLTFAANDVAGS